MKEDCLLDSFYCARKMTVFGKSGDGEWLAKTSFSFAVDADAGAFALRQAVSKLVGELGGCRIIAGAGLHGIPFGEFNRNGFRIFEISEYGPEIFEGILNDLKTGDEETVLKEKIAAEAKPVETSIPGVYYLDLVLLQNACPEVSSKQALREFLAVTPFLELQLVCSHIPPWLETLGLDIFAEKMPDGKFKAVLTKKR